MAFDVLWAYNGIVSLNHKTDSSWSDFPLIAFSDNMFSVSCGRQYEYLPKRMPKSFSLPKYPTFQPSPSNNFCRWHYQPIAQECCELSKARTKFLIQENCHILDRPKKLPMILEPKKLKIHVASISSMPLKRLEVSNWENSFAFQMKVKEVSHTGMKADSL